MPSPKTILEATLSGAHGPIQGNIPLSFATALTAMVRKIEPTLCIEIGMAYGICTLAILEGLDAGGRLVSVDPFQSQASAKKFCSPLVQIEQTRYISLRLTAPVGLP